MGLSHVGPVLTCLTLLDSSWLVMTDSTRCGPNITQPNASMTRFNLPWI